MRYQKNHNFFKNKNPLNSYWAGFIAADGNISSQGNALKISLSAKDAEHLGKLSSLLSDDYCLRQEERALNDKVYNVITFGLSSKQWKDDLEENWNITPAKSLTLKFPEFDNLENKKAFICGYIDGDGSICVSNDKLSLQILGTESFLSSILVFLVDEQVVDENIITIAEHKRICTLSFGSSTAISVLEFLYNENLPLLERKWDKFLKHKGTRSYRTYNRWTEQDNEILRENHGKMSVRQIMERFFPNRTYTSIEKRCNYLGLKKHYEQKWTDEEKTLLWEKYNEGMRQCDIWKQHFPDRTYSSVKSAIQKLKKKT